MATTDARPIPIKNTAFRAVFPILDADGDLVTGATGLDSEVSKDQGTFADCTNEATEIATSSGMYYLDLTSTEMNADCVAVIVKTSSSGAKTTVLVFYPEETGDINVDVTAFGGTAGTFASGRPETNTTHIAGSAVSTSTAQLGVNVVNFGGSAGTFASGRPEVNTTHAAGTAWGSGAITAASIATDAITAAKIAADAIGASELAADAVAEIADGVWDEAMSGHLTLGTYGQVLRAHGLTGEVNTASATTTSFAVDGFTEATADHFNGSILVFTSGACLGQARTITDYSATTQVVTLAEALTDAPADNDDIVIIPGPMAGGTLQQVLRLFVTLLSASGEIQATTLATDTITAAKIAADAITSSELAASAVTEIQSGLSTLDAAGVRSAVGLASANLDTQLTAIDDYLDTEVAAIKAKTDQLTFGTANRVDAQVYGMEAGTVTAAAVATGAIDADALASDAVDEIWAKALSDISAVPGITASALTALNWLFVLSRNKLTQTATTTTVFKDDGSTSLSTSTVSDDATTFTRGEFA